MFDTIGTCIRIEDTEHGFTCVNTNNFTISYTRRLGNFYNFNTLMTVIISKGCQSVYLAEDIDEFHNYQSKNEKRVCPLGNDIIRLMTIRPNGMPYCRSERLPKCFKSFERILKECSD